MPSRPGRCRRVQARRPGPALPQYISDSFQSRRDELKAELKKDGIKPAQIEKLLESRDEYTAERVFWVPLESRWPNLQNQATRPDIATLIDDAILAVGYRVRSARGTAFRQWATARLSELLVKPEAL